MRFVVTQIAADWYMAHRAGPLSQTKREEFLAWIKASPMHIEEYLAIASLERALPEAVKSPRLTLASLIESAQETPVSNVADFVWNPLLALAQPLVASRTRRNWWAVAALVSLSVAGVLVVSRFRNENDLMPPMGPKTYVTAHGEQSTWRLPDGSILHLDTDTSVTVRLSSRERLLELDHGQIAVTVEHDLNKPLRVHAGSTTVTAVGTEFDVFRTPEADVITVMTGAVDVSSDASLDSRSSSSGSFQTLRSGADQQTPAAPVKARDVTARTLHVGADQQVRVANGVLPAAPTSVRAREVVAWLEKKIIFDRRPLGEVADEFNRYNVAQVVVEDPALRRTPISGAFSADDTESFAAFLASLEGVHVDHSQTNFRVYRSPPQPPSRQQAKRSRPPNE